MGRRHLGVGRPAFGCIVWHNRRPTRDRRTAADLRSAAADCPRTSGDRSAADRGSLAATRRSSSRARSCPAAGGPSGRRGPTAANRRAARRSRAAADRRAPAAPDRRCSGTPARHLYPARLCPLYRSARSDLRLHQTRLVAWRLCHRRLWRLRSNGSGRPFRPSRLCRAGCRLSRPTVGLVPLGLRWRLARRMARRRLWRLAQRVGRPRLCGWHGGGGWHEARMGAVGGSGAADWAKAIDGERSAAKATPRKRIATNISALLKLDLRPARNESVISEGYSSFPRKRESREAKSQPLLLDPRLRGGDDDLLMRLASFQVGHSAPVAMAAAKAAPTRCDGGSGGYGSTERAGPFGRNPIRRGSAHPHIAVAARHHRGANASVVRLCSGDA